MKVTGGGADLAFNPRPIGCLSVQHEELGRTDYDGKTRDGKNESPLTLKTTRWMSRPWLSYSESDCGRSRSR